MRRLSCLEVARVALFVLLAVAGCSSNDTGSANLSVSVAALSSMAPNVAHITVVANMTGQQQLSVELTNNGSSWTGTMPQIPAGNSWVFTGTAYDASNNALYTGQSLPVAIIAQQTATVLLVLSSVNPPPPFGNHAPHIDSIYISDDHPQAGESVQLVVGATDPDSGDQAALVYAWTGDTGGVFTAASSATTGWSAAADGHYNVTIDVTDPHSAFDQVSFGIDVLSTEGAADISVQFNEAPQVLDIVASTGHLQPGVNVNVLANVTDDDPSTLTYAWTDDCGGAFAADPMNPNPTATVYTPAATNAPSCTLTLTVTDADGLVNTGSLTIVVGADPAPMHGTATAVAPGRTHTCAIVDGGIWCWGYGTSGALGDGNATSSGVPVVVTGLTSGVDAIAAGDQFTCALAAGQVYCWGYGFQGQLGTGYLQESPTPVGVVGLPGSAQAIAAGEDHACALVAGSVYCWGYDGYGALGDNFASGSYSATPVRVSLPGTATAVATGFRFTCAVVDGGAWCWGLGIAGQLGDGNHATSGTPVAVAGLDSGVSAITCGGVHSCALVNGTAMCWGQNTEGELGDGGAENNAYTPVTVSNFATGATAISAGYSHTCALANGGVECWGQGVDGELGDNVAASSSVPVAVSGLATNVDSFSAGEFDACAVTHGRLLCWGVNTWGNLGDGTYTNHLTPFEVAGL